MMNARLPYQVRIELYQDHQLWFCEILKNKKFLKKDKEVFDQHAFAGFSTDFSATSP